MRKLLVAIDASEAANRALQYAIDLARLIAGCELVIINVHEPVGAMGRGLAYHSADEVKAALDRASTQVIQPALAKAKAAGVSASAQVLTGEVAKAIVSHATEAGCDGIVMSTHGRGAVGNLLLGSVATAVLQHAHVPVTVVR